MTWTTWLAEVAIKASALFLLALIVNRLLLRRAPAALRHAIWTLALVSSLAAPMLSALLPGWHVPLLRLERAAAAPAAARPIALAPPSASTTIAARTSATTPTRDAQQAEASNPTTVDSVAATSGAPASGLPSATRPDPTPGAVSLSSSVSAVAARASSLRWSTLAATLWALGAVLLLLRLIVATLRTARLSRRARTPGRAPWLAMARALARSIGAPTGTRFVRSEAISMPIACGIWRPAVVLPAEADAWPTDRLRVVLLHELAHVRRRDCLTQTVADAACAVFWFNPLAWMAVRELRRERERACDDMVLAMGTSGPDYAEHLLAVARAMRMASLDSVFSSGVAMAHRSELEGRLMAILDDARPRRAITPRGLALASAFSLSLVAPLAAMNPWVMEDAMENTGQDMVAAPPASTPGHPDESRRHGGNGRGQGNGRGEGVSEAAVALEVSTNVATAVSTSTAQVTRELTTGIVAGVQGGVIGGIAAGVPGGVSGGVVNGVLGGVLSEGLAPGIMASVAMAGISLPSLQDAKPAVAGEKGEKNDKPRAADPRLVSALTEALKDSDAEVRKAAISSLSQIRDVAIFDAMVVALGDKEEEVRQQAAFALGQLHDRRAVAPLTKALGDASPEVRQQAVFGLGQLRDASSIDGLASALKDSDAEVRQQAAFALGQIRDARTVPALITALQDKDDEVRQQAAFALSQLRDPRAVDGLLIAIKDANAEVRQQALFALGEIGDPRGADAAMTLLKDPNPEVRQQAAHALGQMLRK